MILLNTVGELMFRVVNEFQQWQFYMEVLLFADLINLNAIIVKVWYGWVITYHNFILV